jgi:hypothetical protein
MVLNKIERGSAVKSGMVYILIEAYTVVILVAGVQVEKKSKLYRNR